MAFPRLEPRKSPALIGKLLITLFDYPSAGETAAHRAYRYELQTLDADGHPAGTVTGKLVEVMNASRLADLDAWLEPMRYKALSEVIPKGDKETRT